MPGDGEKLAWIMGSSRSGSTWLLRLLAATGRAVAIDDPHIGHHLGPWRPIPLAWAASAEPPRLTTLSEVKRDQRDYFFSDHYRDDWLPALRALLAARFGAQAREVAAERGIADPTIVVKEPGSQAADLLLELFPRAGLVFLLRDGRDVVDSWLDAYQDGSWAQEQGAFPVSRAGRLDLIRWLSSVWVFRTGAVARAFEVHDPRRRVLVRYEHLLADTEAELARVAAAIGLEASPGALAAAVHELEFGQVAPAQRGAGKAVRAARPGGWREHMSERERRAMNEILEPTLAQLGYGGAGGSLSVAA